MEAGVRNALLDPLWNIGGDTNDAPTLSIALPHVPVKTLAGRLQVTLPDCRIFECERCHELVRICRHCDRGNRFRPPCAPLARAEKQRAAGNRYQKTKNGRLNHKVRQEDYREKLRKKVTHHGDLEIVGTRESTTATKQRASKIHYEHRPYSPKPPSGPGCCDFCGRPCKCPEHTRPPIRRPHADRRGPRLPRYEMGRRC